MYGLNIKDATSSLMMQQKNEMIEWPEFCRIIGLPVISEGHAARAHHVAARNAVVQAINGEIKLRNLPCRLHVSRNVGVKVVNSDHVAPKEIEIRFRRCVNAQKRAISECLGLCNARGMSDKDKVLLSAVAQSILFGKNAMGGAVMQLESIPTNMKLDMMKMLSDGKGPKLPRAHKLAQLNQTA
jgi:hypothetical protein